MFNGCVINYSLSYPRTHQNELTSISQKIGQNYFSAFPKNCHTPTFSWKYFFGMSKTLPEEMYTAIAIQDTGSQRAGGKWGQGVINKPGLNDIKIFLYLALIQIFISINLAFNPSFYRLFCLYFNYPLRGYKRKKLMKKWKNVFLMYRTWLSTFIYLKVLFTGWYAQNQSPTLSWEQEPCLNEIKSTIG